MYTLAAVAVCAIPDALIARHVIIGFEMAVEKGTMLSACNVIAGAAQEGRSMNSNFPRER